MENSLNQIDLDLTPRGRIIYDTLNGILNVYKGKHCNDLYNIRRDILSQSYLHIECCEHVKGVIKIDVGGYINFREISYIYTSTLSDNDYLFVKCLNYNMLLYNDYMLTRHVSVEDEDNTYFDYETSDFDMYRRDLVNLFDMFDYFVSSQWLYNT